MEDNNNPGRPRVVRQSTLYVASRAPGYPSRWDTVKYALQGMHVDELS